MSKVLDNFHLIHVANTGKILDQKKKVLFTVTCLEKNGSVGRDFFFIATQTTEMHILAVIMLYQHKFCVYKRKRKLKLLITFENFVL